MLRHIHTSFCGNVCPRVHVESVEAKRLQVVENRSVRLRGGVLLLVHKQTVLEKRRLLEAPLPVGG